MNLSSVFRVSGRLEGASFLVLLFIAMPLKYGWDWPLAVRVAGMAHGLLFIAYIVTAFTVYDREGWTAKKLGWALLASLLPFGPFWFERRHLREPAWVPRELI